MNAHRWQQADRALVGRALDLALELHRDQVRKGSGAPYIAHPLGVAALVAAHHGSPVEVAAALLHDTVEDGGGEPVLARIEDAFGSEVARIVRGCSDSVVEDRTRKAPWLVRRKAHLEELRHADPSVALVTAADKLDNARGLIDLVREDRIDGWHGFQAGRDGTLWYLRSAHAVLSARPVPSALLDELGRAIELLWELSGCPTPLDDVPEPTDPALLQSR
jgi:(p)ppGpp synthase/HD superfamily hydrolase